MFYFTGRHPIHFQRLASKNVFCLLWPSTNRSKPIKIHANRQIFGPSVGIFARLLGIVWNFPKKEGLCCGVLDESINESTNHCRPGFIRTNP
jgi:hypothetical protein